MNTHDDFRKAVSEERENLTRLANFWTAQIRQLDASNEKGCIRIAVGQTNLLLNENFKRFETLIEQSENNTAEKYISINDLLGLWDLLSTQVREIKEMFENLKSTYGLKHGKFERQDITKRVGNKKIELNDYFIQSTD